MAALTLFRLAPVLQYLNYAKEALANRVLGGVGPDVPRNEGLAPCDVKGQSMPGHLTTASDAAYSPAQ
jgi:hypothetical protein